LLSSWAVSAVDYARRVEDTTLIELSANQAPATTTTTPALTPAVVVGAQPATTFPAAPASAAPATTTAAPTAVTNAPPKSRLDSALDAVKEDIVSKVHQVDEEKQWVASVKKIIEHYQKKIGRVEKNIVQLRDDVKRLYKKKKQIENLKLQEALKTKLNDATQDLNTLQAALKHVKAKADEFSKTRDEIQGTINNINNQLGRLRGEPAAPAKALVEESAEVEEQSQDN